MENFFDLLDIETQNVIRACAEEVENEEINAFLELSCNDPHLMDFMFGGNDAYYTFENEFTRKNRKFNCREKVIKLKASERSQWYNKWVIEDIQHIKSIFIYMVILKKEIRLLKN